jgi:hypothetical protein
MDALITDINSFWKKRQEQENKLIVIQFYAEK